MCDSRWTNTERPNTKVKTQEQKTWNLKKPPKHHFTAMHFQNALMYAFSRRCWHYPIESFRARLEYNSRFWIYPWTTLGTFIKWGLIKCAPSDPFKWTAKIKKPLRGKRYHSKIRCSKPLKIYRSSTRKWKFLAIKDSSFISKNNTSIVKIPPSGCTSNGK